jgi:hypothetical protein
MGKFVKSGDVMPHLDVKTLYHLQLNADEFKLLGLALAGKLKGTDKKAAHELNVRLQESREQQIAMQIASCKAALNNAKEAASNDGD